MSTVIYYPDTLKARWPNPLAAEWQSSYPGIFDDDDFCQTQTQPTRHFHEWLAAIHLFHRDGAYALLEKYHCGNHDRQVEIANRLLGPEGRAFLLQEVRGKMEVQPPDLLLFLPDYSRFWFAEVKGPNDSLSEKQVASHAVITKRFNVPVEIIQVQKVGRAKEAHSGLAKK
jgi:hypothetical protein